MKFSHYFATIIVAGMFTACAKDYSAELPGSSPDAVKGYSYGSAVYSLNGSPYACTSDSILGNYTVGQLLDSSNRIVISVLVDTVGTYSIYTANLYGIAFSGSGTFTKLGVQNISLYGYGTPVTAGTFNYIPGEEGCSFALTISGPNTTTDCKACIYMPVCEGSRYTYIDSSAQGSIDRTVNYFSRTDTTLDGSTFSKVVTEAGNNYYSCSNGMTIEVVYNEVPDINGDMVPVEYKHIVLESNGAIGSSWTSNIANSFGQNETYVYRIVEKGITRTVSDSTYNQVIHVNTIVNITTGGNTTPVGREDFYYQRGVGLIEKDSSDYNSSAIESRTLLQSYTVPQ